VINKVTTYNGNGIGFGSLLFLLFLGLKLTGHIDWSWWWVTAPLWIPLTLGILVFGFALVFTITVAGLSAILSRK
jgi:hypothetical protein